MNSWQLKLTKNHQATKEYSLKLINKKANKTFRNWFGPLALQIYHKAKRHLTKNQHKITKQNTLTFDKHFAQHVMIEASLYQQLCHHHYQTVEDLELKGLSHHTSTNNVLLYIRMTAQHPSRQTIKTLLWDEKNHGVDHDQIVDKLVQHRLIQKFKINDHIFYDKNPYPHNHLYNVETNQLTDCDQSHPPLLPANIKFIKHQNFN